MSRGRTLAPNALSDPNEPAVSPCPRRLVDRSRPLVFTFDGLDYQGYAGDTLASALIANGVHLVGRSFKYHRPRGILSAGAEEPNALVTVARGPGRVTPNLRATQIELFDGLRASSQNRWPSLAFDLGAVNDLLSPLFGAGFYYKTFMGPNSAWAWARIYEPLIRRAAGLGAPPREPDPDRYTRTFDHCDVLIIGAGPAGLAAALAASQSGARVVVCDENPALGGSLLAEAEAEIDGKSARNWLDDTLAALRSAPNVRLMRAHAGVRLLRAEFRRAQRAHRRSRPYRRSRLAARTLMADARAGGRAGDRRDRAPARLCE